MTREIKFRAWDIQFKRMKVTGMGINGGVLAGEDVVIEQFTGLKDKTGREIYEGDIVLVEDHWTERICDDGSGPREFAPHLAPVVFFDSAFGAMVNELGDCLCEGFHSFSDLAGDIGLEKLEVIGNVHENPELLS